MIEKLFVLASACVLSLAIFGCSSSTTQSNDQQKEGSSNSSLFTVDEWPQNETTEGVPVPHFSVGMESLSTSDGSVQARWENVSENEASSYIDEVKQAGFTYEVIENKSSDYYGYSAWNHDESSEGSSLFLSYTSDGVLTLIVSN